MKQTEDFIKAVHLSLNTKVPMFERKTVWLLMRHIEALEEEKELLLMALERSIDEQKAELPVIPLQVAEAILYYRSCSISNQGIIEEVHDPSNRHGMAIREWINESIERYEILLKALVNGYTVKQEPTQEERLNEGIQRICKAWYEEDAAFNADEILAQRITEFVQGCFYADQNT